MSSLNLSIESKEGERVPVSQCKLEPLNLLIPGNSRILVPKHKVWPGQKKKETIKVQVPPPAEDSYDAEEECDLEERPAAELKSRKVIQAANSRTERKRRNSCKKNTKQPTKTDNEVCKRKKLAQRIKEQEDYIAKLKAKYAGKETGAVPRDEAKPAATTDDEDTSSAAQTATTATEGETTDASDKVRSMLEGLKIKAAGKDGGAETFTPSEDAQILARKDAGESFGTIASFMKRPKKQISKRHKELVEAGKTIETVGHDSDDNNGDGAATDAATAGETTDVSNADAEKDAQPSKHEFGGLFDFGTLTKALEVVAEKQAGKEENNNSSSCKKKNQKGSPAKSDKSSKKDKGQDESCTGGISKGSKKAHPGPASGGVVGGESGYESGSEAVPDDIGAILYMNQYARRLLRHKDRIPAADDKFDENDCILLAMAEGRHETDRWEHIQARFANLTGRMVPIDVLKYKLGGGEKPEDY